MRIAHSKKQANPTHYTLRLLLQCTYRVIEQVDVDVVLLLKVEVDRHFAQLFRVDAHEARQDFLQ